MVEKEVDLRFYHPSCILASGNTGSGKTTLTLQIIRYSDQLFTERFVKIYFCYFEDQKLYEILRSDSRVEMIRGLPDMETLKADVDHPKLLVLDDAMKEISENKKIRAAMSELFFRGSHHWNMSVLYLAQAGNL